MRYYFGVDIGGTKCAVLIGNEIGETIERVEFPSRTDLGPDHALSAIYRAIDDLILVTKRRDIRVEAAGISCGGPLDMNEGVVMSPPNLPGWDEIPITRLVEERARVPSKLLNDADASALAEYRFGAGRGSRSMAFLTFGTGLGAGFVLDGRLYSGVSGLAGEIGHVRIAEDGPEHYGKTGSLEGYCSGSGLASLAVSLAKIRIDRGERVSWYTHREDGDTPSGPMITAAELARLAKTGDSLAIETFELSGTYLGRGCAMLIDLLNLDRIVIGSVYVRCRKYLEPATVREIEREALPLSRRLCRILPAELGERIGDVASLCVAMT